MSAHRAISFSYLNRSQIISRALSALKRAEEEVKPVCCLTAPDYVKWQKTRPEQPSLQDITQTLGLWIDAIQAAGLTYSWDLLISRARYELAREKYSRFCLRQARLEMDLEYMTDPFQYVSWREEIQSAPSLEEVLEPYNNSWHDAAVAALLPENHKGWFAKQCAHQDVTGVTKRAIEWDKRDRSREKE